MISSRSVRVLSLLVLLSVVLLALLYTPTAQAGGNELGLHSSHHHGSGVGRHHRHGRHDTRHHHNHHNRHDEYEQRHHRFEVRSVDAAGGHDLSTEGGRHHDRDQRRESDQCYEREFREKLGLRSVEECDRFFNPSNGQRDDRHDKHGHDQGRYELSAEQRDGGSRDETRGEHQGDERDGRDERRSQSYWEHHEHELRRHCRQQRYRHSRECRKYEHHGRYFVPQ